jgi:putative ABC transport system ATP-binding protein
MLKLHQINKRYQTESVQTTALKDIHLEVARGEFVAIMGPSGCGKSTLLNVIGLLDAPDSGEYWFDQVDVAKLGETRLAELRKKHIGFIFQSFNLIDELSVFENIELALLYHDIPAAQRRERVAAAMDRVGIAHRAKHRPSQLSGGQQQRVAVGRAVVANPAMILADEPTGNLDSAHGDEVMRMLASLNASGTTVIMVTHTPQHADYASRIVHLVDGQIAHGAGSASPTSVAA